LLVAKLLEGGRVVKVDILVGVVLLLLHDGYLSTIAVKTRYKSEERRGKKEN